MPTTDTTQRKITASLIAALILVITASFSGLGETFRDSGIMMRLFLIFVGAIMVGFIFAIQVIPGLITLDGMMKRINGISRKKETTSSDNRQ